MKKAGWQTWHGVALTGLVRRGGREAVRKTSHVVLEAAKQQVPHDEGTLERSGQVIMAPGNQIGAVVTFGGGSGTGHPVIPYAVRWHENNANFQKGRKMRYLADPFNQLGPRTYLNAMAQEIGGKMR